MPGMAQSPAATGSFEGPRCARIKPFIHRPMAGRECAVREAVRTADAIAPEIEKLRLHDGEEQSALGSGDG